MVEKLLADASPEKRLFISLLTRDISLADALLDIVDNSINAALEPLAEQLRTASDYQKLLASNRKPKVQISLQISPSKITIIDTASGISHQNAKDHVFKFGRAAGDADKNDRLSVYGLGLKRAMFKCGNLIKIASNHKDGGFDLKLNAKEWARKSELPWQFEITTREPTRENLGTTIAISELYDDVARRLDDGLFVEQLQDRLMRTYSFFIGRVVDIEVNGKKIERENLEIGANHTSQKFVTGKVSCFVTAGIAAASGAGFRDRNAGWFVFCNGRAVLFADKSATTGWSNAGLPIFQPKHRPFLGTVFFVSTDPEALPWTTTKSSINEESVVWQEAKRHMVTVGRAVIGYLDQRYTESGGELEPTDLQGAAGARMSVLSAAVARERSFSQPRKPSPTTTKVQYDAKVQDVKRVAAYLRRPSMTGSEVGRYTFRHFLENEVGE